MVYILRTVFLHNISNSDCGVWHSVLIHQLSNLLKMAVDVLVGAKFSKIILTLRSRNKITVIVEIQFCMRSMSTESITLWSRMNSAYRCRQSQKHSWDIPNKRRNSSVSLVLFICCLALHFLFSMAIARELIKRLLLEKKKLIIFFFFEKKACEAKEKGLAEPPLAEH